MSRTDLIAVCEDLLAMLAAAETRLRVQAATRLPFPASLALHRASVRRARALLEAEGFEVAVLGLTDIGDDSTDELLQRDELRSTRASGLSGLPSLGSRSSGSRRRRRRLFSTPRVLVADGDDGPVLQVGSAPSIPLDDGPEGSADDGAPLGTDEEPLSRGTPRTLDDSDERTQGPSDSLVSFDDEPSEDLDDDPPHLSFEDLEDVDDPVTAAGGTPLVAFENDVAAAVAETDDDDTPSYLVSRADDDSDDDSDEVDAPAEDAAPDIDEDEDEGDDDTEESAAPAVALGTDTRPRGGTPIRKRRDAAARLYAAAASVPRIRDTSGPKPRAAAIQLQTDDSAGQVTGTVLGDADADEPIAIGAVEDYDEDWSLDSDDHDGGFRVAVEEYEEEEEEEEEELPEIIPEPLPEPEDAGPTAEELEATLAKAREATARGELDQGVNLYSDVLDADPDNLTACIGRGRIYLDLGDYARAMSDFTVAEDIAPDSPEPQVATGDLYFARKEYRKAIECFDAALEASPEHAMAFCRRGISHYYRKNYTQALEDLTRAQNLDPEIPNIRTYVTMARRRKK